MFLYQGILFYREAHCTIPTHCLLANVMVLPGEQILRREIGPPLAISTSTVQSFWSHLCLMGGEWMWEYVVKENIDVGWIRDALANDTFLAVTDGSYDRGMAGNSRQNQLR